MYVRKANFGVEITKYIAWSQQCISCYNLKHVKLAAVLLEYLNLALCNCISPHAL